MPEEPPATSKDPRIRDVSVVPEPQRFAREVKRTGVTQVLYAGDEEIAVLAPAQPKPKRHREPKRPGVNDWLKPLIGMGAGEAPHNVTENVDTYLAQASHAEIQPPKTP